MKLNFIFIILLTNFLFKSAFSSEKNNQEIILEDNSVKSIDKNNFNERKLHIVQKGDNLFNISKMYSLNKKFLIKINQLTDENYIFVGQTLKLTEDKSNKLNAQNKNIPKYHQIKEGDNLTEISNRYGIKINELINLNDLDNPDKIEVGTNLILINLSENIEQNKPSISTTNHKKLLVGKKYGPLTVESTKLKVLGGRKTLNVINKNKTKLIISLKCETKEIDVRKKGRKWKGWVPAKENFEEKLMNDFC